MQVILSENSGFCFGVRRAVDTALALSIEKKICTLGPLIHNPDVIEILKANGVDMVDNINDFNKDKTLVIRTHGVSKKVYELIEENGIDFVDLTCPFVKKIHTLVTDASEHGDTVIITGDENHAEVKGILGHSGNEKYVVKNAEEFEKLLEEKGDFFDKKVTLVSQTTYNKQEFDKISKIIANKHYTNIKVFDTICNATNERQDCADKLSKQVDAMIVVGGNTSSNSKKLYDICKNNCKKTYFCENVNQLDLSLFSGCTSVGITAGASTPDYIIKEVLHKMVELKNETNNDEISFEQLLEDNFKMIRAGQIVTGVVVAVSDSEIQMDLGTKHAGYLTASELTNEQAADIKGNFTVGQELEVQVIKVNDLEGTVLLSKKRLDNMKGWDEVVAAYENGAVISGKVEAVVKGGILVSYKGMNVFVPASQATLRKDDDLNALKGQTVNFKVIDVEKGRRRRAVGSIRTLLVAAQKEAANTVWESIEEGKEYTGTVKSITNYGVFVDIGGVDGMVHVSELSWNRIKHPSEVVKVGDTLNVFVNSFDKENKRISLGYKKSEDNPFVKFVNEYKVDDVVEVTIARLMPYGAFAQIIDGVDGLIHISQISDKRINAPADVLKVGQVVNAKIIEINEQDKKVNLSIRATLEAQADEVNTAE